MRRWRAAESSTTTLPCGQVTVGTAPGRQAAGGARGRPGLPAGHCGRVSGLAFGLYAVSTGPLRTSPPRCRLGGDGVPRVFPNGQTRLSPALSSEIARSVVETVTPRFLQQPFALWRNKSSTTKWQRGTVLFGAEIGLRIVAGRNLSDLMQVDLGPVEPVTLFVKVAAIDGLVSERRRESPLALIAGGGLDTSRAAFLTAYADRHAATFEKTVSALAWASFARFASERGNLLIL